MDINIHNIWYYSYPNLNPSKDKYMYSYLYITIGVRSVFVPTYSPKDIKKISRKLNCSYSYPYSAKLIKWSHSYQNHTKKRDQTYIHETTHHISNVCSPSVRCQSFDARYTSRVDRVAASRIQKLVKNWGYYTGIQKQVLHACQPVNPKYTIPTFLTSYI